MERRLGTVVKGWSAATLAVALMAAACAGPVADDGPIEQNLPTERDTDGERVAGAVQPEADPVPEPVPAEPIEASFDDGDCRFDPPEGYKPRCGTVTVPMDWASGRGTVDLAVAVFPGVGTDGSTDPVFHLEGGPGGHALETIQFAVQTVLEPLTARGDLVLFDQRGAGLSEPRLECNELTDFSRTVEDDPDLADAEVENLFHRALSTCRSRLIDDGIDLAAFNTINNANDVEAIRVALGYERVNLVGVSYGTKLGLEVLRRYPDSVRAAVLDSVYPPQVDSVRDNPSTFLDSYRRVADACRNEPACAERGDLIERFRAVAARYENDPVRIQVIDSGTGDTDEVFLTGATVGDIVTDALYSPYWFTDLLELVDELERGETAAARSFLSHQRTVERYFTTGMFFAISCQEEISFADPAEVGSLVPPDPFGLDETFELGSNTGLSAFSTCEAFPSGRAPDSQNQPVESDVPTLLLAGRFDPVTPVEWAEVAAETLSDSHLIVAPLESHGVSSSDCGVGIVLDFLAAPGTRPDDTCLADATLSFSARPTTEIEPVEFVDGLSGLRISSIRPTDWVAGTLGGDVYRRDSFLDPTQFFQLVGDEQVAELLEGFLTEDRGFTIGDPSPFGPGDRIGSMVAGDPVGTWRHRTGGDDTMLIDWFEADVGPGPASRPGVDADVDDPAVAYVIMVSTIVERDDNLVGIVSPALSSITIRSE